MPRVFVSLVVLNLADVATDSGGLPGIEVTDTRNLTESLNHLMTTVGLLPNLGTVKLVGVVSEAGAVQIGYRVRTRSMSLAPGFKWEPVSTRLNGYQRALLDRAWEGEQT